MKRSLIAQVIMLATALCTAHAKENVVQCANLIYAGTHTSRCFSDEFLSEANRNSSVQTERRFKSVKLASKELFNFPFVMMTGEEDFHFTAEERNNLKHYLNNGGFLLASAGCSSKDWNRAFRREMRSVFGKDDLKPIPADHPVFHTVKDIDKLILHDKTAASEAQLEGIRKKGKLVVIYSPHGLNDTAHTEGCCCCGGNEIENALDVNVNILIYALLH